MRRLLFVFSIVLFCASSLFASFSYSLDLISLDPLHKEYFADKNSANFEFNYIYNISGMPDHIFQDTSMDGGIAPHKFDFTKKPDSNFMSQFKIGESLSFLRSTFEFDNFISPISFDLSFQPTLNLVFDQELTDSYGYEGIHFLGLNMSVADVVSLRMGSHHYCSHYGDAIIKRINPYEWLEFNNTYKYIRMNTLVLGLSITPIEGIRVYGEYNWVPKDVMAFRPVMYQPSWLSITVYPNLHDQGYKARIINIGFELSYDFFKKLGTTSLGFDAHFYEEGQIVYKDENGNYVDSIERIRYDKDRPWKREISIVLSQQLSSSLSLEVNYVKGASPLNYFYYIDNASWVRIGIKINPDSTLKVVDGK